MQHKAEPLLKALIVLVLIFHVSAFLLFSYRLLIYPYDWEPSESDHIVYAERILNGESLYKADDSFPLLCMNYPPGYHLLLTVPVKLFGPNMFAGRILALAIAATLCLLIYKIINDRTGWKFLGLVMAVSLLAYGPVSVWLAIIRVDSLYVLLSLAAMYLLSKGSLMGAACRAPTANPPLSPFSKGGELGSDSTNTEARLAETSLLSRHEKRYRFIIAASVLLACSFFIKQQGIFALGAGALYFLINKKYRECAVLIFFFALFTVPLNLGLDYLTDGWYNRHLFASHFSREFSWQRAWFLIPLISACSLLAALSCFEIFNEWKSRKISVWTCYLLGTLPIAFLIFYDGTAENYFLPLFSGILIMGGFGLERLSARLHSDESKSGNAWPCAFITLQLLIFCGSSFFLKGPAAKDRVQLDALAQQIRSSGEPALVDRMNSLIIGTPHEDYFMQPVLLKFLYQANKWEPDVVVSAVNEQRFSLICMFDKTQFVRPVREAIHDHYVPVSSIPIRTFRPGLDSRLVVYEKRKDL